MKSNNGICGENLRWSLVDGELSIIGTGLMTDFEGESDAPWDSSCIETVELPNGLENIGDNAFHSCDRVKEISIPGTVKVIGKESFNGCESLTKVGFPDGLEEIDDCAFYDCESLRSINIPGSVKRIGVSAFNCCLGLKTVQLNEGLEVLDAYAFEKDVNLKKVTIPTTVKKMETKLFPDECNLVISCGENLSFSFDDGTLSIKGSGIMADFLISGNGEELYIPWPYQSDIKAIKLPEGLTSIGENAFCCTELTTIHLPDSLKKIGNYAFESCHKLKEISIPKNIKSIGEYSFSDCVELSSVEFEEGIEEIGSNAFEDCEKLKKVVLPLTIKKIGDNAFPETCEVKRQEKKVKEKATNKPKTTFATTRKDSQQTTNTNGVKKNAPQACKKHKNTEVTDAKDTKADIEKAKIEVEKAKIEAEKAKTEAERAKAELEKAKLEFRTKDHSTQNNWLAKKLKYWCISAVCFLLLYGLYKCTFGQATDNNDSNATTDSLTTSTPQATDTPSSDKDGPMPIVNEDALKEPIQEVTEALEERYTQVGWQNGLYNVYKDELWGFCNRNGEDVCPPKYDYTTAIEHGLYKVCRNEKMGFVNALGKEVIPPKYDYIETYIHGLFDVSINFKHGLVNRLGQEVVPCEYDQVQYADDGKFRLEKDDSVKYIDVNGKFLYEKSIYDENI